MRLALANVLALIAFGCVLWSSFAFILGFATNHTTPLGFTFRFSNETFGFALIYMMFIGPFALLLMLLYFAAFRARAWAIGLLAAVAILLGLAFMTPWLRLSAWPGVSYNAGVRLWIMIVWSGVVATFAHHVVFALLRPRKVLEAE